MKKMQWFTLLLGCMVMMAAATGCKTRKPGKGFGKEGAGDQTDPGNVFGIAGSDVMGQGMGFDEALAGRPPSGSMQISDSGFAAVNFGYDSAQVDGSQRYKLEDVATYLQDNPEYGVMIEGHTDEKGSPEYNLSLGERRAIAVREYLAGLGVDANRIQTNSKGEEVPVEYGHEESSWSVNRRAEFVLFY